MADRPEIGQVVDLGQQKGLLSHTIAKNPLQVRKNVVPLHRQKEINPDDKG
jgi:predicted RNA binding protein YcfA (HicA-like mRNA interferase family)